jgi:hydrogenase maturation protein HypF
MKLPSACEDECKARRHLRVSGIVQGIGFRPYIYRLAQQHKLTGFVRNTPEGVVIEIEGAPDTLDRFVAALPHQGPPLMRVDAIEATDLTTVGDERFIITESESGEDVLAWVPADIAACESCLAEMHHASDRRHSYPFINCTNCGPRYSIILDIPYDRVRTTMAGFSMCKACRDEYDNPMDRRFHAQPNACSLCGPHLWLVDRCGKRLPLHQVEDIFKAIVNVLRSGGIVVWKGLGGYQIACDARNTEAVNELRRRKHRNEKPFAVMVRDIETAKMLCEVSEREQVALAGAEKPIVLLRKRPTAAVSANVAPDNSSLGVMLPYTPMHDLLLSAFDQERETGGVLVMTSGNISEEPIVMDESDAREKLSSVVDLFLHHDRPIYTRVDDSVVRVMDDSVMLLRRARGYSPVPLWIGRGEAEVLACGAQQKSTLCMTKAGYGILSQHIGDLENYETLQFFEQVLERMQRLFRLHPRIVAHDLHPSYLSTQLAKKMPADRHIGVQHHHAHIAGCMAEHGLKGPVIGIAWDGTGYGPEGTIWGGEFLIADYVGFERYAHLRNVWLAGGDAAVRQPWRLCCSYLHDAFDNLHLRGLPFHGSVPEASVRLVDTMLKKRVHGNETSSCGRLFDAVASLVGLCQTVSFEGQAAMMLETVAGTVDGVYDFLIEGDRPAKVDMRPMVRQIIDDVQRKVPLAHISARFHNTLIAVAADVCERARSSSGLKTVCLSGGCFQNVYLLRGCLAALRAKGFDVYFPQHVPVNDGGIAFGQAAVACERIARGI